MYKTIEQIEKLKAEKQKILYNVYQSNDPDEVYRRQSALGSMSISIYTDAANAVMPMLKEDGVNNIVWSSISMRLGKLSFISIPMKADIIDRYKKAMANPTVVKVDEPNPKRRTKLEAKFKLPAFLAVLAAQGIIVPVILSACGVPKHALVLIDIALMTIEVIAYFSLRSREQGKTVLCSREASVPDADYEGMYERAIREAYRDNKKILDDWFDALKQIAAEEIDKASGKVE